MPGSMTDGNPNDGWPDRKLVRIAVGPDRALTDDKSAINISVTEQEREFLARLQKSLGLARSSHAVNTNRLHVQDLPE